MPYGNQTLEGSLVYEDGFKQVIGALTEGRYLTFEMNGYALTNPSSDAKATGSVSASKATSTHGSKNQRWIIHYANDTQNGIFQVSSALDGRFIGKNGSLVPASKQAASAANFNITFSSGNGYSVEYDGEYLTIGTNGKLITSTKSAAGIQIYSVSYHN